MWSGGVAQSSSVGDPSYTTQWNTVGEQTVSVKCGSSVQTLEVTVVEVISVITSPVECVESGGTTFKFSAVTNPSGFGGVVLWSAANATPLSGNGSTFTTAFDLGGPTSPGIFSVTATAGTSSVTREVAAVEVASLEVTNAEHIDEGFQDLDGDGQDDDFMDFDGDGEDDTSTWVICVDKDNPNPITTAMATPNPNMPDDELPGCWSFTGATNTGKRTELEIPLDVPKIYTLTAQSGVSKKVATVYVTQIDLQYNELAEETGPIPNEENPGGFICVNDNDNAGGLTAGEGNGIIDIDDPRTPTTPLPFNDEDLKEIFLTISPNPGIGTVTFEPGNLKVWTDKKKTNIAPETWDLAVTSLPGPLYIEGEFPGENDVILRYQDTPQPCEDKVKITSQKVEFETFPDNVLGPDKPHLLNLDTRQNEEEHYDPYIKCVSHVWDGGGFVDLSQYLTADSLQFASLLEWYKDGQLLQSSILDFGSEPDELEIERFDIEVRIQGLSTTCNDRLILVIVPHSTLDDFTSWFSSQSADTSWLSNLPSIYSTINFSGPNTPVDPEPSSCSPQRWRTPGDINSFYHPGAFFEMRSEETAGGHGHQGCYNSTGSLIGGGVSAGSADRVSAFNLLPNPLGHRNNDVYPFIWAAQLDGNPVEAINNIAPSDLNAPLLHEGHYLQQYLTVRPPLIPNQQFTNPGGCSF